MMRKFAGIFIVFVVLFGSYYVSQAEMMDVEKKKSLLDVIVRLETMRDQAAEDIRKFEAYIQKNESSIGKSQSIISLAQQKGNMQAETIAREALIKAQDAKKKNEETLTYCKFHKDFLDKRIAYFQQLVSNLPGDCNCKELEARLQGYTKIMKSAAKTGEMNNAEFIKWEREEISSHRDAIMAIIGAMGLDFEKDTISRTKQVDAIKKQVESYSEKYINTEPAKQYLFNKLSEKTSKAMKHYLRASEELEDAKKMGEVVNSAQDMKTILDTHMALKNSIELTEKEMQQGDANLLEALTDPKVRELSAELASSFIESAVAYEAIINKAAKSFQRANLAVSGFAVLRDVAYAGLKFKYSYERLIQIGEAGEQEYKAMSAIIERTKMIRDKLKECRCK